MSGRIHFRSPSNADLAPFRQAYLTSLDAPLDGMWEAFGLMARSLEIRSADDRIGYGCLNDEGRVLQFFVVDEYQALAHEAFSSLLERDDVRGALVSTADPNLLGFCLDAQTRVTVHTLFYADRRRPLAAPEEMPERTIAVVNEDELTTVAELQRDSLEQDPGDWLLSYLGNLVSRSELYTLRQDGEILATGEIRVSDTQPPYADLGVITIRRFRGRGVAGYLLGRLRSACSERGLKPICSTTVENVASRRAIERSGFVSRHRLLEVEFSTDPT